MWSRKADQRGSAIIEAGLVLLPMMAFVCAVIDASMVMFMKNTMRQAAREGVRYAITGQTEAGMCQDESIKTVVQRSAMGFLAGAAGLDRIEVAYYNPETFSAGANTPGNIVQVSVVRLPWSWIVPIFHSSAPLEITASSSDLLESAQRGDSMPLTKSNAHRKGTAILEFAVSSTILLPMFFGTLAIGLNLGRNLQVTQVSRDLGVMYSRGIDFSKPASQSIAQKLASGFDLSSTGDAVIILSQVAKITSADCAAGGFGDHCTNEGSTVFLNRIVIGNPSLRPSNFGTPVGMNAQGNIPSATYLDDPAARGTAQLTAELAAADVAQRQGEVIFLVESYLDTPALNPFGTVSSRGVYAKAIF